jgi:prepilin-type N-terminal cleavage/methylation domain-containing protein
MMNKRKAFTLIELLVVISIIALLVGILMPALGRARTQAQQVYCLSNLRGMTVAVQVYAQDFKGYLPHSGRALPYTIGMLDINEMLLKYQKLNRQILHCPGDKLSPGAISWWKIKSSGAPWSVTDHAPVFRAEIQKGSTLQANPDYSYYWNNKSFFLMDTGDRSNTNWWVMKYWKLDNIKYPSRLITVSHLWLTESWIPGGGASSLVSPHLKNGHNAGFPDGHAAFVPWYSITPRAEYMGVPNTDKWRGKYNLELTPYGIRGVDVY